MPKYIDADALINQCEAIIRKAWNKKAAPASWSEAYNAFEDDIEEFPAADVVEVKHGAWIQESGNYATVNHCSVCGVTKWGRSRQTGWCDSQYCGACGAKMDAAQNKSFVEDGKEGA